MGHHTQILLGGAALSVLLRMPRYSKRQILFVSKRQLSPAFTLHLALAS